MLTVTAASCLRRAIRSVTTGAVVDPVTCAAQDVDVRSLISSQPPRLRDSFLLHYYGGSGIREVAALLRSLKAREAAMSAVRARLKTTLGKPAG